MGLINCVCIPVKCCIDRTSTINPEHLLNQNSKERENLNQSRINVPFRLETPANESLQIISCSESKNLEDQILPNDSLESIQYYSNFENGHSEISSIKSSKKDSKYRPTLFKNSSLNQKEEIYFPEISEVNSPVEILEEEKSIHNYSISSKSEKNVRKAIINCNSKNQQDL